MARRVVYEFERCEAATAKGHRCARAGDQYVKNPGAIMGFLVCPQHELQGQRLIERDGELPRTWGKYNFYRGIM